MRARLNGVEIAYDDTGDGLPVVLIHGFPLDRTMWAEQTPALAGAARLVVPDLRGFGESEAPAGPCKMETYAEDIRALLDHVHVDRAVIAGISMGGYVAFAFARLFPKRLRALILCDTKAAADSPEARAGRAEMAELARAKGAVAVAEKMLLKMLAPETPKLRPDLAEAAAAMMGRAPVHGIVGALHAIAHRADSTPILSEIACPVLFVVGEHDAITPPDEAAGVVARLRNARLVVVRDAGHLSPLENPSAVNSAMAEFLGEVAAAR